LQFTTKLRSNKIYYIINPPANWETGSVSQKPKQKFTVETNDEIQQDLNKFRKQLEKEKQRPVTNQEIFDKLLNQTLEDQKPTNKTLTPEHKKHLKHKHKEICTFPNRNKTIDYFHHTNRKALTPKPTNIVPLCKEYHQIARNGTILNIRFAVFNHPIHKLIAYSSNGDSPLCVLDYPINKLIACTSNPTASLLVPR